LRRLRSCIGVGSVSASARGHHASGHLQAKPLLGRVAPLLRR